MLFGVTTPSLTSCCELTSHGRSSVTACCKADYGTNLPVHSRIQRLWFDTKTGLLRRNDYTPVAATSHARVANVIFEHGVSSSIPYSSKRRVKLSLMQYGWVLPIPDLI